MRVRYKENGLVGEVLAEHGRFYWVATGRDCETWHKSNCTPIRKFKRGDVVDWEDCEWVVVGLDPEGKFFIARVTHGVAHIVIAPENELVLTEVEVDAEADHE